MAHTRYIVGRLALASILLVGTGSVTGAYAAGTTSGFDTQGSVTDLPIAIQGTTAVDVTPSGIAIGSSSGPLNAAALSSLYSLVKMVPCGASGYIVRDTTHPNTYTCAYY